MPRSKMPEDAKNSLKRLIVAHSQPCQFQARGISPERASTVFEMFAAYKAAGMGETRFRMDLLDTVPYMTRHDEFYDRYQIYKPEGLNLTTDQVDVGMKHVLKDLFQVHVPGSWSAGSAGEYAEVIDWREHDGARLVKVKTRDGREIEGPEDDLATEFYHKFISPEHQEAFKAMVQEAVSNLPEATGHTIWDARKLSVDLHKPVEKFLREIYSYGVPRDQRVEWEKKTGASAMSPSLLPLLRSAIGPAFILTVPHGEHEGKEGHMVDWRKDDGRKEVGLKVDGAEKPVYVPEDDLVLPWDMPSAAPAPR